MTTTPDGLVEPLTLQDISRCTCSHRDVISKLLPGFQKTFTEASVFLSAISQILPDYPETQKELDTFWHRVVSPEIRKESITFGIAYSKLTVTEWLNLLTESFIKEMAQNVDEKIRRSYELDHEKPGATDEEILADINAGKFDQLSAAPLSCHLEMKGYMLEILFYTYVVIKFK